MDAQADLSLRWVHTHFVGFCHVVAQLFPAKEEAAAEVKTKRKPVIYESSSSEEEEEDEEEEAGQESGMKLNRNDSVYLDRQVWANTVVKQTKWVFDNN